jgi:hypothetical protein
MIRVDEYGWVREYDRTPTQPEMEAINYRLDVAEVALRFHQTDPAYGCAPITSPANNLPKEEWGSVPQQHIVDAPTAPLSFDDPTVPGEAFEDVDLAGVDQ